MESIRLSKHETNDLILRLEERKYGQRYNSMELAQKANVSLDFVNDVERQIPITDPQTVERISHTLGVTPDLLAKIAGWQEIPMDAVSEIYQCVGQPMGESSPECQRLGMRPTPWA